MTCGIVCHAVAADRPSLASLPAEVNQIGVTLRKQTPDVLMYYVLYSPDGTYDPLFLKNYGTIYVTDVLKRIPGVGNVNEYGSEFGLRIWLDPTRMAKQGITVSDILAAVKEQNVQVPAGILGQYPAPPDQVFQYSVLVQGRLVHQEDSPAPRMLGLKPAAVEAGGN